MRWLAYLHPAAMLAILALGLAALREGLRMRRLRLRRRPSDAHSHLRLARPFVVLVALGYGSGLASMAWLRGEELYTSPHAALTTAALVALLLAGALGLRLERQPAPLLRLIHLVCGSTGMLLALAAAVAGFDILP
jgi:predicted acyltransferase